MGRERARTPTPKTGVIVRPSSLLISFTFEGKQYQKRLQSVNGESLLPTSRNIVYAERLVNEIKQKIKLGLFSMAEYFAVDGEAGNTVGWILDSWLATLRIQPSTLRGYQSAVNFWKTSVCDNTDRPFGAVHLRAVKLSQIKTAIAKRPDLTGKGVNNYMSCLRQAFALAHADGLMATNPAADIPAAKHQKEPPDPFSREESEQIIAAFHKRYPGPVANMVEFWFWTGLRTSELYGLRWDKVDLNDGHILIDQAVVQKVRKDTKTSKVRYVRLNSRALEVLKRQRFFTFVGGSEVFKNPNTDAAWFESKDYNPFARSYWETVLKRLGMRYRRPYNMRHSYATAMLMSGMNHSWCAKQLGHSIDMFQRTYTRWLDGEQDDREMMKLEATLPKKPKAVGDKAAEGLEKAAT